MVRFGNIPEDLNALILIALAQNTPFLLFQIAGFPRSIQVMERNKVILHIGASAELRCGAHQDTDLPAANLCKQLCFFSLCIRVMDEGDLLRRHTSVNQLLLHVVVDIETAISFGCGQVAEYQLCGLLGDTFLPDAESVANTGIS